MLVFIDIRVIYRVILYDAGKIKIKKSKSKKNQKGFESRLGVNKYLEEV